VHAAPRKRSTFSRLAFAAQAQQRVALSTLANPPCERRRSDAQRTVCPALKRAFRGYATCVVASVDMALSTEICALAHDSAPATVPQVTTLVLVAYIGALKLTCERHSLRVRPDLIL
jgi:hypothetical protein